MLSDREREEFTRAAARLAADALTRGEDARRALSPLFCATLQAHPDEEDRLLQVWDSLLARPAL
jgi:hypothetical protein